MVFGPIWQEFMSPKKHGLAATDVKTAAFNGDKNRLARPPMGCSFRKLLFLQRDGFYVK
jgi:hypothetical protein